MTWWVEARELLRDGAPSGIFHIVADSDEGGGVVPCCKHEHRTKHEAETCPEAIEASYRITGIRPPPPEPTLADLARAGFEAYGASTGGKTWDGKPIPPFDEIRVRTPHVAAAWEAAADAIRKALR